ncbi:MAG TPA: hypothetical protein VNG12_07400, partial [Acidimicrobiales bacterium]|nr:hypothetical protein [Acidimicrobiales bacterium]
MTDGGNDGATLRQRRRARRVEARWRPLARFVLSIGIAAGACELIWQSIPGTLSASSTTFGYPTFVNYDVTRYSDAYFLLAFGFPGIALATYALLSWIGLLRRSPAPSTTLLPLAYAGSAESLNAAAGAPRAVRPSDYLWGVIRLLVPAVVVTVALSASSVSTQRTISLVDYGVGVLYVVLVVFGGLALSHSRSSSSDGPVDARARARGVLNATSRVNSLAGLVVVPLTYFVSRGTSVTQLPSHHVVRYSWLPLWLVCLLTLIAVLVRRRWVHAEGGAREMEANVLVWIVGPVLLFLLVAFLPGVLGQFGGFDDAQSLASPELIFGHGLLPWRDLYLIHGILSDAFSSAVGFPAFGNSRWGGDAGTLIYAGPAYWMVGYFFVAHMSRKNPLVLAGFGAAVLAMLLQAPAQQFLVVPICLMLFAALLQKATWTRCALFGFAVVSSMILVPEAAIFEIGLLPLVLLFELLTHERGQTPSFARTVRCLTGAATTALGFLVYLLATHSFSAFVNFYLEYSTDHAVSNGLPVQWNLRTDPLTTFFFFAPMVLWLMTVWRVATKLVRRTAWSVRDWTMVAAATVAIFYFPKVVERADPGHVREVFSACIPLVVLWGMECVGSLDGVIRRTLRTVAKGGRLRVGALTAYLHPASALAVTAILVFASVPFSRLPDAAASFHVDAHEGPTQLPRLGYTTPGSVDTALIANLGKVIARYAGPHAAVMDFTNQVGIIYYLLNRVPATRYFHIEQAFTLDQQEVAIRDIKRSNPPVVVYSSQGFGLPLFDGLPMMVKEYAVSEYLLNHYRPIVDFDGELILLRDDLARRPKPLPRLTLPYATTDLYNFSYECNFGDLFNFYPVPSTLGSEKRVAARLYYTAVKHTYRVVL